MDPLDVAILGEMSRDRIIWWGSRDPRVSAGAIASTLGVERSTVWARLRRWEGEGFLRGYDVQPNPAVFGARVASASVRVDEPAAKAQVLRDLALMEGALTALEYVGPWIAFAFAHDTDGDLSRRRALLARLEGVDEATPCRPLELPILRAQPTPLDWRIVAALRATPTAPLARIAKEAGVSTRTLTRRYQALIAGGCLWMLPVLDFSRARGGVAARLHLTLRPRHETGAAERVLARLRERHEALMLLRPPTDSVDVLVHVPTVGAAEDAQVEASHLDDVEEAELLFPKRVHAYREWLDERTAVEVGGALSRPGRAPLPP